MVSVESSSIGKFSINKVFGLKNARSKKRFVRYSIIVANILILGSVATFIINNDSAKAPVNTGIVNLQSDQEVVVNPLDEISSTDIAVNVARMVRLEESTAVVNQADTVITEQSITESTEQVVAKPQIVNTALKSKKDIKKYSVIAGDTVSSIAQANGVTSESIRWSNDLSADSVAVGREIVIPPVTGIVYTVKQGDTIDSIASKFKANKDQLTKFNDAEVAGLVVGEQIVVPDGKIEVVVRAPRASTTAVGGFAFGSAAVYGYNGYDYGWCTWWAAKRRADVGKPVPANFGNACNWVRAAQRAGIPTGRTPQAHDVIFTNSGCLGHVAFVEEVNEDGSIWVTDMNSRGQVSKTDSTPAGGWNRVSWRRVTPDQFGRFQFIH